MGNAVQIVALQPTHVIYIAFCKKKNEKKCGDIRNTQAVVSQPTHVLENKKNFCSHVVLFCRSTQVKEFVFPAEKKKEF